MEVATKLHDFIKFVINEINVKMKDGLLILKPRLYVKTHIDDIKIEKTSKSYKRGASTYIKNSITPVEQLEFVVKHIIAQPNTNEIVSILISELNILHNKAKHIIDELCRFILRKILDSNDINIEQLALTCIRDLDNAPVKWCIKLGLDGIYLLNEEWILLYADIIIRKPIPEDLEIEHDALDNINIPGFDIYYPSVYLCTHIWANSRTEIETKCKIYLQLIRLIKVSSLSRQTTNYIPDSLREHKVIINEGSKSNGTYYTSDISSIDIEPIRSILTELERSIANAFEETDDSWKSISVALERYNSACWSNRIEEQITTAITCLEALFLKPHERSELSHRLAQRCTRTLRFLNLDPPNKMYKEIIKSYDIRSTYIHGGYADKDSLNKCKDTAYNILNYSRLSLIIFLINNRSTTKDKFLSKLDNCLLDPKASDKLDSDVFNKLAFIK